MTGAFGGYLYFHKAPTAQAFHEETVRKLGKLHLYDCLRANKSLAAWGVEGRVPFLDKDFLDIAMRLNPREIRAARKYHPKENSPQSLCSNHARQQPAWRQIKSSSATAWAIVGLIH